MMTTLRGDVVVAAQQQPSPSAAPQSILGVLTETQEARSGTAKCLVARVSTLQTCNKDGRSSRAVRSGGEQPLSLQRAACSSRREAS